MILSWEISDWGRMPVTRPARFNGLLAWLCLASGALALPLSAEEITVTVPPDPAPQAATANPAPAAPLPSFSAGGLQTSAADSDAADQGSAATPPAAARSLQRPSNPRSKRNLRRRPKQSQRQLLKRLRTNHRPTRHLLHRPNPRQLRPPNLKLSRLPSPRPAKVSRRRPVAATKLASGLRRPPRQTRQARSRRLIAVLLRR